MGDLLAAVGTAQTNIDQLAQPAELRAAAERVVELAKSSGAFTVLAASPVAERLVGAVLQVSSALRSLTAKSPTAGNVLIVDVNLASGTAVAQAARLARKAGAEHIHAAVLHQLTPVTARAADCGVDELTVLEQTPSSAISLPSYTGTPSGL
ncbi:phosphoribosyltransferase [Streptomyces sp. NPDC002623]